MRDINLEKNIKKLVIFFSILLFSIIGYLSYFYLYDADKVIGDSSNQRIALYNNEILRGSILDRNGKTIASSARNSSGGQDRTYANGPAFAHITGYNSTKYDKTGIELAYNDILQGKNFLYNVFGGMTKSVIDDIKGKDKRGNDVCTTIDYDTQLAAYNGLGSDLGAVAAINPKTGEIIAMASTPSYDPKNIDSTFDTLRKDSSAPFVNRAASGYYPPGSTFKMVTLSSALENHTVGVKDMFTCNGKLNIDDYVLRCEGNVAHGHINLETAFKWSCNITFGTIGMKLGFNNLKNTAEKFMFNKPIPTGDMVDSIKIKSGNVTISNEKNKALLAQDSIGQNGVTANPMQMALVTSAVANNGTIMKPYIIQQIKNRYGTVIDSAKPQKMSDAITPETASTVKDFMVETVKSGTGMSVRINGVTIGGKTGSAEDKKDKKTDSWFVAFAPADNPQIAVAVIVESAGMGGGRAASIARDVIKTYLKVK